MSIRKEAGKMDLKNQCLEELRAGHLGMAMKIVEDNHLSIDQEIKDVAVEACIESLKRHFHWIIPLFVTVFDIAEEPEMNCFAGKLLVKALRAGDYPLAVMIGNTFNIKLDPNIERLAKEIVLANINKQAEQLGVIVMTNDPYKYNFDLED